MPARLKETKMYDSLSLPGIGKLNAFHLAKMADCKSPSSATSVGAEFLEGVRDLVVEALEYDVDWTLRFDEDEAEESVREIANQAPNTYTGDRWNEFIDIQAWDERSNLGEWPDDLTDAAGIALYQIAERLAMALFKAYIAWRDSREDDEDDDLLPANAGSAE